jgi:hypothetical protein
VVGHFFIRTFGVRPAPLHEVQLNAHRFCSCCSPSTLASDEEERSVGRAVGRSVTNIDQPPPIPPLSTRDKESLSSTRRTRKRAQILKISIAGSRGQLKVRNEPSGSFSARTARSPNSSAQAWSYSCSWHAIACSSVLRCLCIGSYRNMRFAYLRLARPLLRAHAMHA